MIFEIQYKLLNNNKFKLKFNEYSLLGKRNRDERRQCPADVAGRYELGLVKSLFVTAHGADHGRSLGVESGCAQTTAHGEQKKMVVLDDPDQAKQNGHPEGSYINHPALVSLVYQIAENRLQKGEVVVKAETRKAPWLIPSPVAARKGSNKKLPIQGNI